jgi:hypothetical protein
MSSDVSGTVSIAPPGPVRVAAVSLLVQVVGVLVVAVLIITARHDADLTWALATASYFVVIGGLMAGVGVGLLRGRRWSRNPAIVTELIIALVGFYLAAPSAQLLPGLIVTAWGAVSLGLLASPSANEWIKRFPPPFGGPET